MRSGIGMTYNRLNDRGCADAVCEQMRQFRCFAQACNYPQRLEASVSPCHRLSPVPPLSGYGLMAKEIHDQFIFPNMLAMRHSVHFVSSMLTTKEIDELTLIQNPAMRLGTQQLRELCNQRNSSSSILGAPAPGTQMATQGILS
eukprot:Em0001g2587a